MRADSISEFLVLLLFIIVPLQFCLCANSTSAAGYIIQERQALLKLKESFTNGNSVLVSWEGNDCCQWEGVECDEIAGHVVKLELPSSWCELEADDLNSSILELKHLNYLDLSGISFGFAPIPTFLGSMKQLRYLNLSGTGFSSKIPHHLGNLSNLQVLDVSGNFLYSDDMGWLSKLSSLKHLAMNGASLGKAQNLFQVLDMLPFLLQVDLSDCELTNLLIPGGHVNSTFITNVQVLNLEQNFLYGPIPDAFQNLTSIQDLNLGHNSFTSVPYWLINLRSLVHLDLSDNPFKKTEASGLSILKNMCSLKTLDLSDSMAILGGSGLSHGNSSGCRRYDLEVLMLRRNRFKESLPVLFGQLSKSLALRTLDLSGNLLHGTIPTHIDALSKLTALHLSNNQLQGTIPATLGRLSLSVLDLSNNHLNGSIPESLGRLYSLRALDLSNNHLNGSIPESLGQLGNLMFLWVAHNSLTGIISEIHLDNLSNLTGLQIGFNNLVVKIESTWTAPFTSLEALGMASCNVTHFPQWLETQQGLFALDISNNQISGSIPKGFGNHYPHLSELNLRSNLLEGMIPDSLCNMGSLSVLDLSENRISGKIPNCWRRQEFSFSIINLASNKLSGTIPSSFGDLLVEWLNLSNNGLHGEPFQVLQRIQSLMILDLGQNQFSGEIPFETFWGHLQNLRLRQNLFSGDIPTSLCTLSSLQVLDLADNNLSGSIPPCIGNLGGKVEPFEHKATSTTISTGNKREEGRKQLLKAIKAPDEQWDQEGFKQVLKGSELEYTKNLQYLINIDMSNNNLMGSIPDSLTSISGLIGLNLSHNDLSGKIPSNIQRIKSLESIDFSNNHLSGPIPSSMSTMDNLGYLNLSYNNLSGPIPRDNHFLTFDDRSFVGNPYLCGEPLKNKCFSGDEVTNPTSISMVQEDDNGNNEKLLFYFVIALGFITGFWTFFGILLVKKNWRHAYFRYVEEVADNMHVAIIVRVARLKKWIRRK
ncbi:Leucine-rich repeat [Sesbania bispinosa]|nr:Leucine-rich repeat [Sesbania bispinosa]